MELKRYNCWEIDERGYHHAALSELDNDGEWCLYEEAAAEIARLTAEVETERNRHRAWTDYFQTTQLTHAASRLEAAEDDRRRLRARVAELEGELSALRAADEGAVTVEGFLPTSSPGNDYILLPGDARHAHESLVPGSILSLTIRKAKP